MSAHLAMITDPRATLHARHAVLTRLAELGIDELCCGAGLADELAEKLVLAT